MSEYEIAKNRSRYYTNSGRYYEIQVYGNTGTHIMGPDKSNYWNGYTDRFDDTYGSVEYQRYNFYDKVVGNHADNTFLSYDYLISDWSLPDGRTVREEWRGSFNDHFDGSLGDDTIKGFKGDDTLFGNFEDDHIYGGDDNDSIRGGEGNDALYGENGSDTIEGNSGHDLIYSGRLTNGESDVLTGGPGTDTFFLGDSTLEEDSEDATGGGFDYLDLGLSLFGDISDLAFTVIPILGTFAGKIAKEIVPMAFDVAKATTNGGEDVESVRQEGGGSGSATITDFDFREDVIYIPLPEEGTIDINIDTSDNNLLKVSHDGDVNDIIATVQLADGFENLLGYGDSSNNFKQGVYNSLEDHALIIEKDNPQTFEDGHPLNLENVSEQALESLGTNKFLVLGAYGPISRSGTANADYMYGTNFGDTFVGFDLTDGTDGTNTNKSLADQDNGADRMYGFGGKDHFAGGGGHDFFDGGDGYDWADYTASPSGIHVYLGGVQRFLGNFTNIAKDGHGTIDEFVNIENIMGSDQDDTVTFNDVIEGGQNGTSIENAPDDGTDEAVNVAVYSEGGTITPEVTEADYNLMNLENIIGTDNSNDTINFRGLAGPLSLSGNDDNSVTIVDTSTDEIYTVTDFENINFESTTIQFSGIVSDELNITLEDATIEQAQSIGTVGDDVLEGTDQIDFMTGGGGSDTMNGGLGRDIFYFGAEADKDFDTVEDFDPSQDFVVVNGDVYTARIGEILYTQDENDVIMTVRGYKAAIFENVTVEEMRDSDITYLSNNLPDWMSNQGIEVINGPIQYDGDPRPGYQTIGTLPAQVVDTGIDNLTVGSGGWVSYDQFPRATGDFDGDGYEDIIGFGGSKVFTYSSNGDGTFADKQTSIEGDFTYSGNGSSLGKSWDSQNTHPRVIGDIDGDGNDDIVGFHEDAIYSSLSNGDGTFTTPQVAYDHNPEFTHEWGWTSQDKNPRTLADVNGDGYDDIIGFSNGPVRVALSNGDGTFANAYSDLDDFGYSDGYTSQDEYPRMVGDLNGDGFADILAINDSKLNVAFGRTNGNGTFMLASDYYNEFKAGFHHWMSPNQGWDSQNTSPRMLADINGDGKDDLIGFNPDDNQIYVSYSKRDGIEPYGNAKRIVPKRGFEEPVALTNITGTPNIGDFSNQNQYPRMVGDITGNGQDDILAFNHDDIFAAEWL
ncbi:MAG: FG-GAP-like repeat-containing protein [Trichodesmium sp. MO_231.B1]|nr:FG-GAP-like repeat-containing protein [Trichodesmium sp. MO_231.B1]